MLALGTSAAAWCTAVVWEEHSTRRPRAPLPPIARAAAAAPPAAIFLFPLAGHMHPPLRRRHRCLTAGGHARLAFVPWQQPFLRAALHRAHRPLSEYA